MSVFDKVYLDNNATTEMPPVVQNELARWTNRGNPSSGYESAAECREMMSNFRRYLGILLNVNVCCDEDRDSDAAANVGMRRDNNRYKVIITSGASESNSTAINAAVNAYKGVFKPNIVISAVEHKSIISCAESLVAQGRATLTRVPVNVRGIVSAEDVKRVICAQTCIVCVMAANNETGAINNIATIGEVCRKRGVHYHCDAVQIFGKAPPKAAFVDSMSISFHKLHGPPGVGALVVKQSAPFVPLIHGTQGEGLRGGTENVPGIAAAYMATRYTMHDRATKNARQLIVKQYIIDEIARAFHTMSYEQYMHVKNRNEVADRTSYSLHNVLPLVASRALVDAGLAAPQVTALKFPEITIVVLSPAKQCLPNTILLSIVKQNDPAVCNTKIKDTLEKMGVIISVGSACNTADAKASHVLYAMHADDRIRAGCLRISLGDMTDIDDAKKFTRGFIRIVNALQYA